MKYAGVLKNSTVPAAAQTLVPLGDSTGDSKDFFTQPVEF